MDNLILKRRAFVAEQIQKSFDNDIEKAAHGVYEDNAENRRLNRVGQEYGHAAKDGEHAAAKRGKGDEPKSVGDLVKQRATEASTEALKRASKDENAKPEVRDAAKKELENRNGVENNSNLSAKDSKEIKRIDKKLKNLDYQMKQTIKERDADKSYTPSDDPDDFDYYKNTIAAQEKEIARLKKRKENILKNSGANKGDGNDEQNDDTEVEQIDSGIVEKYKLNKKQAESYMKLSQDEDASGLASIVDGVGYSLVDRDTDLKDLLDQGYEEDSKIFRKTFLEKFADKMSAHNDAISSAVEKYGLNTFKAFMKENSETISDKELNHIINQALESKENESWIDKKGNEKIKHPKIKKMNEMFMKMTYGDGLSDDEYKEFKDLQEELYNQKMNNKNWRKNHNID